MAAVDVGRQLVKEIPLMGNSLGSQVPKVVMGIADGKFRLQRGFLGQGEPVVASIGHDHPPQIVSESKARFLSRFGGPIIAWSGSTFGMRIAAFAFAPSRRNFFCPRDSLMTGRLINIIANRELEPSRNCAIFEEPCY